MWYAYVSLIILTLVFLFMEKNLSWKEIYLTSGIIGFGAWLGDVLVGDVFKAFRLGPSPDTYFIDYLFVSLVPILLSLIFLNFLPKVDAKFYKILWIFLAFAFEAGADTAGFMVHTGWRVWYSLPLYAFIFYLFLPWHLSYMRGTGARII